MGVDRNDKLKELLEKKMSTMRIFKSSEEYTGYIEKNKDRISSLSESMKQYYTPEVLALQEKINTYMSTNTGGMVPIHTNAN